MFFHAKCQNANNNKKKAPKKKDECMMGYGIYILYCNYPKKKKEYTDGEREKRKKEQG